MFFSILINAMLYVTVTFEKRFSRRLKIIRIIWERDGKARDYPLRDDDGDVVPTTASRSVVEVAHDTSSTELFAKLNFPREKPVQCCSFIYYIRVCALIYQH